MRWPSGWPLIVRSLANCTPPVPACRRSCPPPASLSSSSSSLGPCTAQHDPPICPGPLPVCTAQDEEDTHAQMGMRMRTRTTSGGAGGPKEHSFWLLNCVLNYKSWTGVYYANTQAICNSSRSASPGTSTSSSGSNTSPSCCREIMVSKRYPQERMWTSTWLFLRPSTYSAACTEAISDKGDDVLVSGDCSPPSASLPTMAPDKVQRKREVL